MDRDGGIDKNTKTNLSVRTTNQIDSLVHSIEGFLMNELIDQIFQTNGNG